DVFSQDQSRCVKALHGLGSSLILWEKNDLAFPEIQTPLTTEESVVIARDKIRSFDSLSGELLWEQALPASFKGFLPRLYADEKRLYVFGAKQLLIFDLKTGDPLSSETLLLDKNKASITPLLTRKLNDSPE